MLTEFAENFILMPSWEFSLIQLFLQISKLGAVNFYKTISIVIKITSAYMEIYANE